MMADTEGPQLQPFDGRGIPQALQQNNRWAPWVAVFDEKRGKWDKIPRRADIPEYGLSTADPTRWYTFEAAMDCRRRHAGSIAGVGYVMTGPHGIVGVDLDRCVGEDGVLASWAAQVVRELGSYAEYSPSGRGVRIFLLGEVADWMNHDIGIEVYGGNSPRFLTVTGAKLPGADTAVVAPPAGALAALKTRFWDSRRINSAPVPASDVPDLLDELLLPDLATLDLPHQVRDFLASGDVGPSGDRSRALFTAGVALVQAGLPPDEVLGILAHNPHAMEVALDHRGQDHDRALAYLWREHCAKAAVRAKDMRTVATDEDFEDVSEPAGEGGAPAPGAKKMRFQPQPLAQFIQGRRLSWLIKRVLPQAELGVIYGPSKSGKSFFTMDMTMAIARGIEWRGRKVKQGAVVYICAEGAAGARDRLRAYLDYHGLSAADVPFYVVEAAPNFLEKQDVKDLVEGLRTVPGVALVVVDTWAQVTPGADENSGKDMGRALAHCRAVHRAVGVMVLLVAHTGKDESRGMRGWSGVLGALDMEIYVERDQDHRCATVTKIKDSPGEDDQYPFALNTVSLGQDEDGEQLSTCVALPREGVSAAGQRHRIEPKGKWEKLVLRIARDLADLDPDLTYTALIEAVVAQMPFAGGKDRRRFDAERAGNSLVISGHLVVADGKVVLR